ncbi:unnamed protein product [Owenia fusiformis]|uniref:Armadillo repeat-containing protein 6 n=1 Tax=Owenia fusiformis TaxID=6347 RepID=A0A8S4PX10_OWEFU|nr:unnamed protein product [Owenia fusiformis]
MHKVVEALEKLATLMQEDDPDKEQLLQQLAIVQAECEVDIAHRVLASSNKAYSILFQATEKYLKNDDMLENILKTFAALINGQPDLLDYPGIKLFMDLLKEARSSRILFLSIKIIALCCVMHEDNRQWFVNSGLIPLMVNTLDKNRSDPEIVKEACFSLRALTFDDDIRAQFGKSHDHAKMIVTETDALKILMNICQDYSSNKGVLTEIFSTLAKLAVRNEFCQEIMDLGGMSLIVNALHSCMEHQGVTKQGIGVLKTIGGNDNVRDAIVDNGGVELILTAMSKHANNPGVCEIGCSALATLALRSNKNCAKIVENMGIQVIIQTMKIQKDSPKVQAKACMALRNLVSRTKDYIPLILEQGAEDLINQAKNSDEKCHDEAKAALRDLGCKVDLKTPWMGTGIALKVD